MQNEDLDSADITFVIKTSNFDVITRNTGLLPKVKSNTEAVVASWHPRRRATIDENDIKI